MTAQVKRRACGVGDAAAIHSRTRREASSSRSSAARHQTPPNAMDSLNQQSQFFFRSYESILPTSLAPLSRQSHRLFILGPCCGYRYGRAPQSFVPSTFHGESRGVRTERNVLRSSDEFKRVSPQRHSTLDKATKTIARKGDKNIFKQKRNSPRATCFCR